jgi:hypothetical protein
MLLFLSYYKLRIISNLAGAILKGTRSPRLNKEQKDLTGQARIQGLKGNAKEL